jgi:hypothetical protein
MGCQIDGGVASTYKGILPHCLEAVTIFLLFFGKRGWIRRSL